MPPPAFTTPPCLPAEPICWRSKGTRARACKQSRAWIWSLNVKGRGGDAVLDRPFDRARENSLVVFVHPEDEAAVDHHPETVQPTNRRGIVAAQVLILPLLRQVRGIQRFKANEETSKSTLDRSLEYYSLLRESGRAIPALMVVSERALARLDPSKGEVEDEYFTRPYSAS